MKTNEEKILEISSIIKMLDEEDLQMMWMYAKAIQRITIKKTITNYDKQNTKKD